MDLFSKIQILLKSQSQFDKICFEIFACLVHEMDEACRTHKVLPDHTIKAYGKSNVYTGSTLS